jgi:hypothetical protein
MHQFGTGEVATITPLSLVRTQQPEVHARLGQLELEMARQEQRERKLARERLVRKKQEHSRGLGHERDNGLGTDF